MKLSRVHNRERVAIVYSTGHDDEVELLEDIFFESEDAADDWFLASGRDPDDFINLRMVKVNGLGSISLSSI